MKRIGQPARRVSAALLLWPLLLVAGCDTTGTTGSFSVGPASEEDIWAIRCITLHTPDRFQRANAFAEGLKRVPGLRADLVQVISDEDGTAVFYGRYRRQYGPAAGGERFEPDHLRDLETIRGLRFQGADVWPFILASMDVLPTYRSSHPEWDLADAEGYWALHVAVFYNTDQFRSRRSTAEQYCAELRRQGYNAYFHHGVVNSSVYIGTYPRGAVTEVRREEPLAGKVTTILRLVDPSMLETQKRFPISLHNGHKIYEVVRDRAGKVQQRLPAPSFPVIIPKAQRRLES